MAAGLKKPPDRDGDGNGSSHASPRAVKPRRQPFGISSTTNPASDKHHRHSTSRADPKNPMGTTRREPKILVLLSDLDYVRPTITIAVRPGVSVAKIDGAVRKHLASDITDDEILWFYSAGTELVAEDSIDPRKPLHYRVSPATATSPNKGLRITFETASPQKRELFAKLGPELTQDALDGKTVGHLRTKFAATMGISDPNTVFLVARGGLRPGALAGTLWEVRRVRTWLCQWLSIEVCPDECYIILRGFGREYLYHPWQPMPHGETVRDVKDWLQRKVFTNVHPDCNSEVDVHGGDIRIFRRGKRLRRSSLISWASTVDFDIPTSVESAFSAEEAWLYPADRGCAVCGDDKRLPEMPYQITKACSHEPTTCRDCLQQWISSAMDVHEWDRLKCPECPEILTFHDVRAWATRETFDRYDNLAMKAALRNDPDFLWCLEPGCGSGQFHHAPPNCFKFVCHSCKGRHCTRHRVKWHSDVSCDDYDRQNKAKMKQDKASEAKIKEISKQCPECKRPVHKFTGCNHITCVCGHEWCYICFEPWRRNPNNGFLTCEHTNTCPERHNNPFLFDEVLMDLPPPPRNWPPPMRPGHGPLPRPRPGGRMHPGVDDFMAPMQQHRARDGPRVPFRNPFLRGNEGNDHDHLVPPILTGFPLRPPPGLWEHGVPRNQHFPGNNTPQNANANANANQNPNPNPNQMPAPFIPPAPPPNFRDFRARTPNVPPPVPMPEMFDEMEATWNNIMMVEEERQRMEGHIEQEAAFLREMAGRTMARGASPTRMGRFHLPYGMEYRPPTPPRSQVRFGA